ncbi:MAG TPA: zinc-dependent metalloprotease [Actinomycetes bacterium]|nr:zinc-dependent metalloprotease [Actinomycetes bacterium]
MSDTPPAGGGDLFGRIPLFREFARLLAGASGPVNWELARQVAVATAAGAEILGQVAALPDPSVSRPDAAERGRWDEHLRLAELWLEPCTTLPGDVAVSARPRGRSDWAEWALGGMPPLVEPVARRMGGALGAHTDLGGGELDAMVERIGGLLFGIQVGMAVGQLARTVAVHYELTLPMRERASLVVIPENVAALERSTGLPGDQLRLFLATHQLVRWRVIQGVGWFREHLARLLEEVAAAVEPDASGLADRFGSLDISRPEELQELLEGDLLGRAGSPALQAALGRLEVLLALAEGYADVVSARALGGRLPALAALQAALRRRNQAPDGPAALFATLLHADPKQAAGTRGASFCSAVLAATDVTRLDRVWAHPNFLPTPQELDLPGNWLERMGLVGGEPVDLDAGLRELLESGGDAGAPEGDDPTRDDGPAGRTP